MRKIVSKQEEEKKKRIRQFVIGGVLIAIMVLSTAGYSLFSSESQQGKKVEYKGIEFIESNGYWSANIQGTQFTFKYNPLQINNSGRVLKTISDYYQKPLYISSEDSDAEIEIYRNLDNFVLRRQYACLEKECKENFPVKNCTDNFIIIKRANASSLKQQDNCIFIEGKDKEIINAADSFLFQIIGL